MSDKTQIQKDMAILINLLKVENQAMDIYDILVLLEDYDIYRSNTQIYLALYALVEANVLQLIKINGNEYFKFIYAQKREPNIELIQPMVSKSENIVYLTRVEEKINEIIKYLNKGV